MRYAIAALSILLSGCSMEPSHKMLAATPPMGWNSWNTFQTHIDEKLIKETADAMAQSGMREAGYVYINLDDGWSTKERDASGNLVPDPDRFPSGMKALADYVHDRGFKLGIYNCAGTKTCAGYPGGHGYEQQDAKLYASWGIDYLKYDWCNTDGIDVHDAYTKMRDALRATHRPIVFSMCEWGTSKPWTWANGVAQLWRTTGDITDIYVGKEKWSTGWKDILDKQVGLEPFAGPGHWNDPDMLVVGRPRMTMAENRAHFSFWCMLAAPLIAGNDLRNMPPEIHDILTNKEIIALNQDSLGKPASRFIATPEKEIWIKELSHGNWAVCLHNPGNDAHELTLDWKELPFVKHRFQVRELWSKSDLGSTDTSFKLKIDSHDVRVFRLTPAK